MLGGAALGDVDLAPGEQRLARAGEGSWRSASCAKAASQRR
jgi:hypothetical protein